VETHRRSFLTGRGIAVRQSGARAVEPASAPGPAARRRAARDEHGPRPGPGEGYSEIDYVAGAIHYWRLDRGDWGACLAAMKRLGVRIAQVAIPWSVHERQAGQYDWNKARDLAAFLDQVDKAGMYAVIEPGPLVGGELAGAGIPGRVLERAELQALTSRATPAWIPAVPRMQPVPSFASRGFQDEVAAWFAAVGALVSPRLAPDGPIISVHVGHEAGLVARLGPYEHDYHPEALTWWHEFAGDEAPPHTWDPADPGRSAAWLRFREVYLARALAWQGTALADAGVRDIARLHGLPWSEPGAFDLPGVQAALGASGTAGLDVSHRIADAASLRRRALYLVGSAAPLPVAVNVPVGAPALGVPVDRGAAERTLLGLLAAGVRGLGLTMAVERSRWYGAPISEVGEPQGPSAWLGRVLGALSDVAWTRLRRDVPVALLVSRADRRFGAASSAAGALGPMLEALVPAGSLAGNALARDPGAVAQQRWVDAVEAALCSAQIPYVLVDESCPVEALLRYRVVLAPTGARVDRAAWQRLHALAGRGVVVVIGPERPTHDEVDRPLGEAAALPPRVGLIRAGSAGDVQGLADDLASVAGDLGDLWITAEQTGIDCSVFADASGAPQVLFVSNRRADERIADVIVPEGTVLVDVLTDEELGADEDGIADVPLGPHEVRMFLVD
jgi:beta-galactosidase